MIGKKESNASVTYNNALAFYDGMYKLKDRVSESMIEASFMDYKSVVKAYKILKELWKYVKAYIKYDEWISTRFNIIATDLLKLKGSHDSKEINKVRFLRKTLSNDIELLEEIQIKVYEGMKTHKLELPLDHKTARSAIMNMGE